MGLEYIEFASVESRFTIHLSNHTFLKYVQDKECISASITYIYLKECDDVLFRPKSKQTIELIFASLVSLAENQDG